MYLANVDCAGCHVEKRNVEAPAGQAATYFGNEKGCTDCHGKEYVGILPEAQKLVDATLDKLDAKLAELKKAAAAAPGEVAKTREVVDGLADAGFNLLFVRKSHGVHNMYFAAQILRLTDESLAKAAEKLQAKVEDTSTLPVISGAFCATLCHNREGAKVPAETVTFRGKDMPHQQHISDGLACTTCHLFGVHKDVKLKPVEVCRQCHEDMQDKPAEATPDKTRQGASEAGKTGK